MLGWLLALSSLLVFIVTTSHYIQLYIIIISKKMAGFQYFFEEKTECAMFIQSFHLKQSVLLRGHLEVKKA